MKAEYGTSNRATATTALTPTARAVWRGAAVLLAALWVGGAWAASAPAWPLNDTGIDWWADGTQNNLAAPPAGYPGQDASQGRDASQDNDADGHAGFSYTKLDANGQALAASANAWSCVRDNVTGLIWEVKADDGGLRDRYWSYSWYNPDATSNGGSPGYRNQGSCGGNIDCDTLGYTQAVNRVGLCGATDWRLPNRKELQSIVDRSRTGRAIDTNYFPDTSPGFYWSSAPFSHYANDALLVDFKSGADGPYEKDYAQSVRLVRGGQALPSQKADQTITFGPAPTVVVGSTGTLSANGGGSGNPVTFSSQTTGVCTTTGSDGSTVAGLTAGTCTIAADQAGNADYNAAPQVPLSFPIGKGSQAISFGAAPSVIVGGTGTVTATGGASGNPVTFTSQTTAVCTVGGTNGSTITGVTAGTCTIAANQAGNANYNAAPQVTQSFAVNRDSNTDINIALNTSGTGFPSPMESDPGWGGGSYPWQILDGETYYADTWARGLAFTGGVLGYGGPCGWRQATVDFGAMKTFDKMRVYHHGDTHIPHTYRVEYWDGTTWHTIDAQSSLREDLRVPPSGITGWGAVPTEHVFSPVTGSKARFALNNCDIEHGWIYEFEVFAASVGDQDADGVPDSIDNCPSVANTDQLDGDGDGIGDACDPDSNAWLRPATQSVRVGATFALDLRLNSRGLKVGAYDFRLTFDPTRLKVDTSQGDQGVSRGSDGISTNFVSTNNGTGVIQVTGFDVTGSGPGADLQFLVIHFTARQVTGATDIALQVTTLADPTGVTFGTGARGARVEVVAVLCGDANGDRQLSIIDALWVARQVAGLAPSPFEPLGADVTGDGQVSIIDALMIARRVAGLAVSGGCLAAAPSAASMGVMATLAAGTDGPTAAAVVPGGGMVSLTPPSPRVESGVQLVLAVQVDSGSARIGAYTLEVGFDPTRLQVDTAAGADQGVSPGAAGLATNIVNVDNIQGRLVVTGFDVTGKGPGASLHLLSLHLRSIGTDGPVPVSLTVRTLADELGQTIGTPNGQGSEVTISDNCPLVSNPDQTDTDGDRLGDACDPDDDNDSVPDANDAFPLDATESVDTDRDGIGNTADTDDDGDAVADGADNCPLAANRDQADADHDGIGNACDPDYRPFCWECLPSRTGWRSILK